jgi:hypothetical protein
MQVTPEQSLGALMSAVHAVLPPFVSAFWSFWPPKAAADCQTLSFSVSFYKIRLGKNHSKSTETHNRLIHCNSRIPSLSTS